MKNNPLQWLKRQFKRDFLYSEGVGVSWETHVEVREISEEQAEICLDTETTRYTIIAKNESNASSYLGCIATNLKLHPGESWHRMSDLPDGPMDQETWKAILSAILCNELKETG